MPCDFVPDFVVQHGSRSCLDDSRTSLVPDPRRKFYEVMCRVAGTAKGPKDQTPSKGCSIKWMKAA
jgi:hypothetical protein